MQNIVLVLVLVGIVVVALRFSKKNKKITLETKEKITEFYKLLPEMEKGDQKTKIRAIKMLKVIKKSYITFCIEVKERTNSQCFGRQEVENLNELINKYQSADISNRKIVSSIKTSVKKIEDSFSEGMLAMYKKMNDNHRNSR